MLEDSLRHIGKIRPDSILPAIYGAPWGYRHRARFSARYVVKKGGALIGFREKHSSHVADMTTCEVVPPRIAALLTPLRALVNALSIPDRLPQLELAIGDGVDALVLRILQPLSSGDEDLLRQFADRHHVQFFLQPQGPESAKPFHPAHDGVLYYSLPEFALNIGFSPTEFTQVNPGSMRCWCGARLRCSSRKPASASPTCFAGSAISRWRLRAAALAWSASKAAAAWLRARGQTPSATA